MKRTSLISVIALIALQSAIAYASLDWIDAIIVDNYNGANNNPEAQSVYGDSSLSLPRKEDDEPIPPPPPLDEAAKYARFIVHYSLWGSLSHITYQPNITGMPIGRAYSISDGPIGKSSGVPYFLMTFRDWQMQDIIKDPRASLTISLAQSDYCKIKAYDPEDPRCSQVILTGKFLFIPNTTVEWKVAQNAVYSRHPAMKNWPLTHEWKFAKLVIQYICLANYFGGNKYPSVASYFAVDPIVYSEKNPMWDMPFY